MLQNPEASLPCGAGRLCTPSCMSRLQVCLGAPLSLDAGALPAAAGPPPPIQGLEKSFAASERPTFQLPC